MILKMIVLQQMNLQATRPTARMDKDWVQIYSDTFAPKAEIIRLYLENNGIPAMILNQQDTAHMHGEIEIFVKRDTVIRAKHLITQWEDE